jgi:predicted transcriptional regulator
MTTNFTTRDLSLMKVMIEPSGIDIIVKKTSIARTSARSLIISMLRMGLVNKTDILMHDRGRRNIFYQLSEKGKKVLDILLTKKPDIQIGNVGEWSHDFVIY